MVYIFPGRTREMPATKPKMNDSNIMITRVSIVILVLLYLLTQRRKGAKAMFGNQQSFAGDLSSFFYTFIRIAGWGGGFDGLGADVDALECLTEDRGLGESGGTAVFGRFWY